MTTNQAAESKAPALSRQDITRAEARALYPIESLQWLSAEQATRCQALLGHGSTFGVWETPEDLIEVMAEGRRRVDLRRRMLSYLRKDMHASPGLSVALDAGALYLTRLALLLRMGPVGLGNTAKNKALDATSLARTLHQSCALICARCIERGLLLDVEFDSNFISLLTHEDLKALSATQPEGVELRRLKVLHERGLWPEGPPNRDFAGFVTPVKGEAPDRTEEKKSKPFPPLPDDYVAEMGQRALWVIRDLGPNIVNLVQSIPQSIGPGKKISRRTVATCIKKYFSSNSWIDRNGVAINGLKFTLRHNNRGAWSKHNDLAAQCEWPPRTWASLQSLVATLQRSHMWLAMLVMAPRQSEVLALRRDCVAEAADGQVYVSGKTFKPSRNLNGRVREYSPPKLMVFALAQQRLLIEACETLASVMLRKADMPDLKSVGDHLWGAVGSGRHANHAEPLRQAGEMLIYLADTFGLDPMPGGKNIHPHRMRKTVSRIAGIAIEGSQKVLMQVLGHEEVATTLLYMQSDPAFAKEIDDVTREIRILRGEALIKDMHAALHDPDSLPFAGHGGGGAPVLSAAITAHEEFLHREGREWDANSARELAVLLTNNGESARLVAPHVVCTKAPGEVGLCNQRKGAIDPGNCKTGCANHIEQSLGRRDVERVIPILVEHALGNIADGNWLPAQHNKRQLIAELDRFQDIGDRFRAVEEVQRVLAWDQ